jgi:purine-binding chemotaxis protein CheW
MTSPGTPVSAPSREWESLARRAAGGRERDQTPVVLRELLVFTAGGSAYAIPVERVREIVRMRRLTPVPRVPAVIAGVIALRGEVVQVLDLRLHLGLAACETGRRTRIIVLHGDDDRVAGILVDSVREVMRVPETDLRPAMAGEGDAVSELFLSGEEFVSILDLDRVLELRGAD